MEFNINRMHIYETTNILPLDGLLLLITPGLPSSPALFYSSIFVTSAICAPLLTCLGPVYGFPFQDANGYGFTSRTLMIIVSLSLFKVL
jgi:hypothetical protein